METDEHISIHVLGHGDELFNGHSFGCDVLCTGDTSQVKLSAYLLFKLGSISDIISRPAVNVVIDLLGSVLECRSVGHFIHSKLAVLLKEDIGNRVVLGGVEEFEPYVSTTHQ